MPAKKIDVHNFRLVVVNVEARGNFGSGHPNNITAEDVTKRIRRIYHLKGGVLCSNDRNPIRKDTALFWNIEGLIFVGGINIKSGEAMVEMRF